ncbi:MAG: YbaB/EbfC family nucleoid-associated protein [Treponema sp.]|jgi:DNA-binding YbaB/EbfC family protein|nr:YbaB/EbfC family nucleoid-associated protein [Treponema sp.]
MNLNPFELLKNAQSLQQQFGKVQEELKTITATGASGGGIVKITINGQMEITSVEIDSVAVDPRDVPMLQDLIIAAHTDAHTKIRDLITKKLGPMVNGLNIPGLTV